MTFLDAASEKTLRSTVALTAARGRGKVRSCQTILLLPPVGSVHVFEDSSWNDKPGYTASFPCSLKALFNTTSIFYV